MKKCITCHTMFKSKRKDAKYCSTKCRINYARTNNINMETGEIIQSDDVVTSPQLTADDIRHTAKALALGISLVEYRRRLAAFCKMGLTEVKWITTGIPEFDKLTMIPRGRITQIQGPYAVGKTTLCLNMIKGLRGKKVLYIDTESSLNPELMIDLDIDIKNFTLYNESTYIEDIADIITKAAKEGTYELIVLDSVPMTTTKTIEDSKITDKNIGQKAFILHKLMERIAMDLKRTDTAMVFINQEREMIGTYVPTKYTPGGSAIPFQASLIVSLKSIKSWRFPEKPKDGIYKGQNVEATIIKSKVNIPWRTAKFPIYYPNPVPTSIEEQKMANSEAF